MSAKTPKQQLREDIEKAAMKGWLNSLATSSGRYPGVNDMGKLSVKPEFTEAILALITAHDKKLLAEVRERVIGEDEVVKTRSSDQGTMLYDLVAVGRNKEKADQRKQLDAIEGEL